MTQKRQYISQLPSWPKFRAVETFPHHVHVGKEDTVEPSFDRTLDQVLKIVRRRLLKYT